VGESVTARGSGEVSSISRFCITAGAEGLRSNNYSKSEFFRWKILFVSRGRVEVANFKYLHSRDPLTGLSARIAAGIKNVDLLFRGSEIHFCFKVSSSLRWGWLSFRRCGIEVLSCREGVDCAVRAHFHVCAIRPNRFFSQVATGYAP
jgi:hypothetical protein